jgi:tetratricopeptide (TPR) repeat protein
VALRGQRVRTTDVRRAALACIFASACLTHSVTARADGGPAPSSPSADAAAAFRNGLALYQQQNYVGAISTWEGLVGTLGDERGWKILYNLGLAYQAVNDVTRAIDRFETFTRRVDAMARPLDPELEARYEDARSRARALEETYGRVVVRAPAHGPPVMTRVGHADPRPAGYSLYLAPGPQSLELGAGTAHVRVVNVDVVAGHSVEIDTTEPDDVPSSPIVTASRAAPPVTTTTATTATTTPHDEASTRPLSPWVWLGSGAAVTAVSFVLPIALYATGNRDREVASALGPGNTAYASAVDRYDTVRTAYFASSALPAALAVATAVVALTRRDQSSRRLAASIAGWPLTGTF